MSTTRPPAWLLIAPLVAGATLAPALLQASSLQGRWGPDASYSEKKSGTPDPVLDSYSDTFRAWESTAPHAETQGNYREQLKTQPVCYDPRKPQRMPWYIEREYQTVTNVVADTYRVAGAHYFFGSAITFFVNFATTQRWTTNYSCGMSLSTENPGPPLDFNTLCGPGTTLNVSIKWGGIWNPANAPDYTYYSRVLDMPSCANGLTGKFEILDDGTDCGNTKRGLGHHWGLSFYATQTQTIDVTPNYTECFFP